MTHASSPTLFADLALRVFDDCLAAIQSINHLQMGLSSQLHPTVVLAQSGSPVLALLWSGFDLRMRSLVPTDHGTLDDVTLVLALREAIYTWAAGRLHDLTA